jgi:DNA primase
VAQYRTFGAGAVERVREAADIASVVGRYVNLSRSGRSLRGLCPFHREKTPSFFVSPERQTYHCFGCGAGGDVFSFLMNYLGLSFHDAIEELAGECGIDISGETAADPGEVLRKALAESQSFFVRSLAGPGGKAAASYLAGRAISAPTCEALGIGWAPPGGALARHLASLGYSRSTLEEAGLLVSPEDGKQGYDRFRDRITFPLRDRRGRTVSFGARSPGEGVPKYLNGPDSPVYRKGELLYGYLEARTAARDSDTVILVEGYFDHARLVDAGFGFVVATCGTALTSSQARQLASLAGSVLVCYDGDAAGIKASLRAVEVLLAEKCYPGVIQLDGGRDPDDFVRESGPGAFLSKMETALDPVSFALSTAGGWESIRDRGKGVQAVRRLARLATLSPDPLVRDEMIRKISGVTGFSSSAVLGYVDSIQQPATRAPAAPEKPLPGDVTLLKALLGPDGKPDPDLLTWLGESDFLTAPARSLFSEIKSQSSEGFAAPVPGRMGAEEGRLLAELMASPISLDVDDRGRIRAAVEKKRFERSRDELRARMSAASGEERLAILRELGNLDASLRQEDS